MNYRLDQDRFYPLLDDIVAQGGFHMGTPCTPTVIDYGERHEKAKTHGCRKQFLVSIPYEGIEQKEGLPVKADGLAVVCAEGDAVELWPRFQEEA